MASCRETRFVRFAVACLETSYCQGRNATKVVRHRVELRHPDIVSGKAAFPISMTYL